MTSSTTRPLIAFALVAFLSVAGLTSCASYGDPEVPRAALRIGTSFDYHPFSTRTLGDGPDAFDGFDVAVARAFAASRGEGEVSWIRFEWPDLQRDFEAGRFDIAMGGVTVRPERSLAGRFSVPVTVSGVVAIVRDGFAHDVSQLERAGVVLAVNAGGHLERVTRHRFPAATVVAVPGNSLVMPEFLEGRADAAITDIHEVTSWFADELGLTVIGPFTRDFKAYWVQPGREDLARELDAWLALRERDGTLDALRHRYFGAGTWEQTALPSTALEAAVAERRALMPLVAEAKRDSGAAVEDFEREAVVIAAGVASVALVAAARGVSPPDEDSVREFFQNEINEAKRIQRETLAAPRDPSPTRVFDLRRDLRPALLRIGDKIAMLLVEQEGLSLLREGSRRESSQKRQE